LERPVWGKIKGKNSFPGGGKDSALIKKEGRLTGGKMALVGQRGEIFPGDISMGKGNFSAGRGAKFRGKKKEQGGCLGGKDPRGERF